jgi:uncharacterized protein YbjT (DUF2867 family)
MKTPEKSAILITGATGNIGTEVSKQLSAKGVTFKAMVRSADQADSLKSLPHCEIVTGNFDDLYSIEKALEGIDRAFLLTSSSEKTEKQQSDFIDIAKKTGVKHIVKQSQWAADEQSPVRFLRYHAVVEQKIRESGLAYTFLRPNLFMQGLIGFKKSIAEQGKFFAAVGESKISAVDIRDIAAVAVEALTEDGHTGKIYNLTGPAAITHTEMAKYLSNALGRDITFLDVPPEVMLQALLDAKFPQWMAEGLIEDYAHYAREEAAVVTSDIKDVTGKNPHNFADFAHDYRNAFLG